MTEQAEWVKAAMSDDNMVVEFLLRLRQTFSHPVPPRSTTKTVSSPPVQLEWTVRQRRSKQQAKKKGDSIRASPTTPLTWSGATTSASGASTGAAADGFEESSMPLRPVENPRSKVIGTSEATTTKKSRKKKTLAELKEEEDLLLKERTKLNQQLASVRVNFENEKATNQSLKKIKLDIAAHQTTTIARTSHATQEAIPIHSRQLEVDCSPLCANVPANSPINERNPCTSNPSSRVQADGCRASVVLPDLNLPVEDDLVS